MADKECPDCKGSLVPIKLIAEAWENPISGIAVQTDLQFYTGAEAERRFLTGKFVPAGLVESYLCSACGRIFLYGTPKTDK